MRSSTVLRLAGIVNVQQSGRSGIVTLRENHPLTPVIRHLFQEERALFDRVVTAVRDAAGESTPDVRAVWVMASSSTGTAEVGVLASAEEVDRAVHVLEKQLRKAEQDLAVRLGLAPVRLAGGWRWPTAVAWGSRRTRQAAGETHREPHRRGPCDYR
jgi:hypothetical protein